MYPYRVSPICNATCDHFIQGGISPLVSAVLSSRGVRELSHAKAILHPNQELLHDPFLLHDMEIGVARIQKALETGESMAVYGDYDVDGITATSLLTKFLQSKGGKVMPYIPQRTSEGYGLNEIALEDLFRKGIRLVITVDCGVSGKDQVAFATTLGIDIIITDHHSCPQELPQALAVINPRIKGYPFGQLAGVGVALKLAQALSPPDQREEIFQQYSDLVAVGTVADVMPMIEENRYFVRHGLEKLNENPSVGLAVLLEEIGHHQRLINTGTIGYNIAPRINAAGRLDRTEIALSMLLSDDPKECVSYAQELCELNVERQYIEGEIFKHCMELLEDSPPKDMIFLTNHKWHSGVVGIVASRLAERYQMPTIMVCCKNGIGKGSCRTFGQINLYDLLTKVGDLLLGFGGHAQAAGFTVAEENIPALEEILRQETEVLPSSLCKRRQLIDARTTISQLTLDEVDNLDFLEPTGAGCPRPSFLLEGVEVVGASLVGGGKHLRLRFMHGDEEISGIYFHYMGDPIYIGAMLDVAFHLQSNHFRGVFTPQLQIFSMCLSHEVDGLYQRWKRGAQFLKEEVEEILPQEEEIIRLSHCVTEKLTCVSFSHLCQSLEYIADLPPHHGEIAMALLREQGLWDYDSDEMSVSPLGKTGFSLEKSQLYAHLKKSLPY